MSRGKLGKCEPPPTIAAAIATTARARPVELGYVRGTGGLIRVKIISKDRKRLGGKNCSGD